MQPPTPSPMPKPQGEWIDPETGRPLPDPYPDYIPCPHCGEAEVEVWSNLAGSNCHNCGLWVEHPQKEDIRTIQDDKD